MKVSAPAILPILRSDTVGDLLATLYLSPDRRYTLTSLADQVKASLPTVTREADRMITAGLLSEERIGRARRVWANTESPLYAPLSELLALTYGPKPVLEGLLDDVEGIEQAMIYGSWAARYRDEPGPPPNDVDVLVIGGADPDELFDRAEQARRALHREVNIRLVAPESWHTTQPRDPFLRNLKDRPLVELNLRRDDD